MVLAEVRSPFFNEERGQVEWRSLALVRADGERLEISTTTGAEIIDPGMSVLDLSSGRSLVASDDPETWTRNLPFAFRSGDIVVEIVADSEPVQLEIDEPVAEGDLPTIPAAGACRTRGCAAPA